MTENKQVVRSNQQAGTVETTTPISTEVQVLAERNIAEMVQRAQAEIQGQLIIARKFPRDINDVLSKMAKQTMRPNFAEKARYNYKRGSTAVSGPSVYLARPLAAAWGNMKTGMRIMRDDGEMITIEAYAWDMETNSYYSLPAEFKNLIYRKGKGWIVPDERDKRELINRHGAIAIRNCILAIIPSDITDDVVEMCKETLIRQAKTDVVGTRRKLIATFSTFGVDATKLTKWLAVRRASKTANIETLKAEELVELRGIYQSIIDGNTDIIEHFPDEPVDDVDKNLSLVDKLRKQGGEKAANTEKEPDLSDKEKAVRDRYEKMCGDSKYADIPEVKKELITLEGEDFSDVKKLTFALDCIDDIKLKFYEKPKKSNGKAEF